MYLHFLLWQDAWVGIDLQYLPESVSRVRQVCSEWKLIWRSLFSLNQRVACFSLNQRQIAFIQIGLHDSTCSKWSEHGKRLTLELCRTWLLQVTRLYASRWLGGGHPLGRRLRSPHWIQFADGKVNLTRVDFAALRACQEMWTIWTCQFLDQVRVISCWSLNPCVVLISIEFHNVPCQALSIWNSISPMVTFIASATSGSMQCLATQDTGHGHDRLHKRPRPCIMMLWPFQRSLTFCTFNVHHF